MYHSIQNDTGFYLNSHKTAGMVGLYSILFTDLRQGFSMFALKMSKISQIIKHLAAAQGILHVSGYMAQYMLQCFDLNDKWQSKYSEKNSDKKNFIYLKNI